ncbi:hypothetical protein BJV82DRAFT_629873 [Fennellomyces sp. T-0311]|nr:hypothetical protein BJV82DRAFT_629873 [Fennellomyces sp. T-0311]
MPMFTLTHCFGCVLYCRSLDRSVSTNLRPRHQLDDGCLKVCHACKSTSRLTFEGPTHVIRSIACIKVRRLS